jgi:hypothetical protein
MTFTKQVFKPIEHSPSPTMNRNLGIKDTFLSLFPSYGVTPDKQESHLRRTFIYDDFNEGEGAKTTSLNRTYFVKRDEMKRYTEELLKTKNMRGRK